MTACADCPVRNRAICSVLEDGERAILSQIGHRQSLSAGQTLMWEGDKSSVVANVIEGVLKLSTSLGDGREQIVGIAYPADFVGRPFGDQTRYTISAITDARIHSFPRAGFEKFAQEHPKLEHRILERTLTELDNSRQWMLLLGRKTAQEKLATFLLDMSERLKDECCDEILAPLDKFTLPFGRQQIANILGLTIETVSRQLTELTKADLIKLPDQREVLILDRNRLQELTDL
ncbi:helix-turn-helix domain-containing protein [Parasphingorhabdus halotolerans]|uniref:Helix-turn-helix domain-containing protein n=2 Tax=Parasphingorhabdus halotolerans TaxID=2725558 RepID=A0A6H2DQD4_9SPHN|nr:helix-turn-helix domain-containing protein [Parasphingorhabdus halotolerans]QJB70872.1 helix-turn-helix domain-containing protein [Parasphingorhabdus halotolerans]